MTTPSAKYRLGRDGATVRYVQCELCGKRRRDVWQHEKLNPVNLLPERVTACIACAKRAGMKRTTHDRGQF